MRMNPFLAALAVLLVSTTAASAHVGAASTSGFAHGFLHPLGGLDHVLAMITAGALAAMLGGRALWLVPGAFVAMMVAGGALGMAGAAIPLVELAIALSVVVLGGAVALGHGMPVALAASLAGLFAVFHGFAHGAEMPVAASGLAYGAGFVLATALLHATGVAAGTGLARLGEKYGALATRIGGAAVSLAGVAILALIA